MSDGPAGIADLGPNAGLVEEMYRLYQDNPQAVAPGWREFFEDYVPRGQVAPPTAAGSGAHRSGRSGRSGPRARSGRPAAPAPAPAHDARAGRARR